MRENGEMLIADDEVEIIRIIYDRYIHTNEGINGVANYLNNHGYTKKIRQNGTIPGFSSSFVKDVLDNEKYIGMARLLDSVSGDVEYLVEENNPAIISTSIFNRVQEEKKKRSNVIKNEDENIRKEKSIVRKRNRFFMKIIYKQRD